MLEIADHAINTSLGSFYERVTGRAKQTTIIDLENCNSDNKKVFVPRSNWNVLRQWPASILKKDMGIRGAFERPVAQFLGTKNFAKEGAMVLVGNPGILAPTEKYVVKMADRAISRSLKPKVSAVPLFHLHLGLTVCLPTVRRTAARRVERLLGKLFIFASHLVRHRRRIHVL